RTRPRSTLFPYTTLFRSKRTFRPCVRPDGAPAGRLSSRSGGNTQGNRRSLRERATKVVGSPRKGQIDAAGLSAAPRTVPDAGSRSEEHTSELQSPCNLVC